METIVNWVFVLLYLSILFFGLWMLFLILKPIFDQYSNRMKSGKLMTMQDFKEVLLTVLTTSALFLFVPFIFLTVIYASLQLVMPVLDDINNLSIGYIVNIVEEATGKKFEGRVFDSTTTFESNEPSYQPVPQPPQTQPQYDPNQGGGVSIQPTPILVVPYNPTPPVLLPPTPVITPQPTKSLGG